VRIRLSCFALSIAYLGAVAVVMRSLGLDGRYDLLTRLFDTLVVALTLPNLLGPLRAAWCLLRGTGMSSGEMLWAWVGIVWCLSWDTFHPHDRADFLKGLAVHFVLLAGLATLLAAIGPRPPRCGKVWAHNAGWAILECDILAWRLFAAPLPSLLNSFVR
jgi:hypothetical protein